MSELIVIGYDDEYKADEVLLKLARLQREYLIDLEDAAVVVRNQGGKVRIKQAQDLVSMGAVGGGFWGMLIGLLFLHPLTGVLAGLAAGAISGALTDIGIPDDFIKDVGDQIEPGTSALFILIRKATPDKVIAEMQPLGGRILRTSLTHDDEQALQAKLAPAHAAAVAEAEATPAS